MIDLILSDVCLLYKEYNQQSPEMEDMFTSFEKIYDSINVLMMKNMLRERERISVHLHTDNNSVQLIRALIEKCNDFLLLTLPLDVWKEKQINFDR